MWGSPSFSCSNGQTRAFRETAGNRRGSSRSAFRRCRPAVKRSKLIESVIDLIL